MATATKKRTAKKTATELRKPQVRVLTLLAKSKKPLDRKEIAEKAEVDRAMLTSYIGSNDPKIRLKNDKGAWGVSLLTRKYVSATETDNGVVYTITAAGRKAIK